MRDKKRRVKKSDARKQKKGHDELRRGRDKGVSEGWRREGNKGKQGRRKLEGQKRRESTVW